MAGILAMECVPVTMLRHPWLHARTFTASAIFFFVAAIFFGRDKLRAMEWKVLSTNRGWVAAHVCAMALLIAVSYTHLDVYKRQTLDSAMAVLW